MRGSVSTGHPRKPDQLYLSLREVADLTEERLQNSGGEAPRPEVHSPDQQYGDVANLPFFPNFAAEVVKESTLPMSMPSPNLHQPPSEGKANKEMIPPKAFPTLAIGTLIAGRFEIVEIISEDSQEHVYKVIDAQGHHCWNCGSGENAEGDEFCIDCGADLLATPTFLYIMHEFNTATRGIEFIGTVAKDLIIDSSIGQDHAYIVKRTE